ncbi:MAG: bifunctional transaldolase/phosoglucose isomerase [Omnitrophica WOR_2 bacterium]
MNENPLLKLESFGQSIWLDYIRRGTLTSGELKKYIDEDGVSGVTSNPSIFEKAIAGSHDYDESIRVLALEGKSAEEMLQDLIVEDIQRTADLFRPMYKRLNGRDGFISLEVSPLLAHNTAGTIDEARRLWGLVNRPNLMIKVPATREGIPAIRQLIGEGINVNITLLFGLPRYREVTEAYISGLEDLAAKGKPLESIASVASFFLSRIDVLIDPILEKHIQAKDAQAQDAERELGQVAIASAKVAYEMYREIFGSERFRKLAGRGARTQRLLWASTSTKNPAYSDVKYVDALIGPETIDTVPVETLNAYRDHGNPAPLLGQDLAGAHQVLDRLPSLGISLDAVTQQLEDEGVEKFAKAFDQLGEALKNKRNEALQAPVDRQEFKLGSYTRSYQDRLNQLEQDHFSERLWRKDPGLWKSDPAVQDQIRNSLGWLHVAEKMEENLAEVCSFAAEVWQAGFRHVVHMGMGGSSLAPLVFARTFQTGDQGLPLTVLDSTDPQTIRAVEARIPLAETLFIVASKSGTTAEPLAFYHYFYDKVKAIKGERAGENFVAITDPGTSLVKLAGERFFRKTFLNFTDIGGRYSALSYFGLVPAALMGLDVGELLLRALRMLHACDACVPVQENPGVALGAALGELALQGRDKVTFVLPESIGTLGMWLEQLIAESTGKEGKGLLPVAGEPLGPPSAYGQDRVFVYFRTKKDGNEALEKGVEDLQKAGQPMIAIQIDEEIDIAQEFFRWEIATATAGAILGINVFDQPNVQESKENTNRLLAEVQSKKTLSMEAPALVEGPLQVFAQNPAATAGEALQQFLSEAHPGDYFALLAYLPESDRLDKDFEEVRLRIRERLHLATTMGYGPRYLHSTGQYHKGGPNTGVFLLLTSKEVQDAPIPGASYTFGVFEQAQALGDLEALRKHGRRVIHVDLGADINRGVAALHDLIESAIAGVKVHG